jgi:hypothetical protein
MNVLAPVAHNGRLRRSSTARKIAGLSYRRVPGDRPRDPQARHARPRGGGSTCPWLTLDEVQSPRQRVAAARRWPRRQPGGGAQRGDRQGSARRAWVRLVFDTVHAPAASRLALLRDAGVRSVRVHERPRLPAARRRCPRRSRTAARSIRSAGTVFSTLSAPTTRARCGWPSATSATTVRAGTCDVPETTVPSTRATSARASCTAATACRSA